MHRRLPPLNSLRAFEVTARHMSFAKAAEELFLTPSALSYQVKTLEEFLGEPLFLRLNRSIELTHTGAKLYPGIHAGINAMAEAVQSLQKRTPDDVLVVSTGPAFASKWLTPRLHSFLEAYPDIELRVSASLKLVNLASDEVDACVRFGMGDYGDHYVEPIFNDMLTPLCSPDYLEKHGGLKTPDALVDCTLLHDESLGVADNVPSWSDWLKLADVENIDAKKGLRFNHADHAIDAAIEGLGIVLGRGSIATRDMAHGRLVAPFKINLKSNASFWFLCKPSELGREKIQAFRTWLYKEVEKDSDNFKRFFDV